MEGQKPISWNRLHWVHAPSGGRKNTLSVKPTRGAVPTGTAPLYFILIAPVYDWRMPKPLNAGDASFYIAASFLLGVFAANMHWNLYLVGALMLLVVGAFAYIERSHAFWKYALVIILPYFSASSTALYISTGKRPTPIYQWGKSAAFFGMVQNEPKAAGNFTMLAVALHRPYAGTIDIFTSPNSSQFSYGDDIMDKRKR